MSENVETVFPAGHLIRPIKRLLNEVLARMDAHFDEMDALNGWHRFRPSGC